MIHPSVYFLHDTCFRLGIGKGLGRLKDRLYEFQQNIVHFGGDSHPWLRELKPIATNLSTFRLLITGNAGVGKSTLLNRVFGMEMVGTPQASETKTVGGLISRASLPRVTRGHRRTTSRPPLNPTITRASLFTTRRAFRPGQRRNSMHSGNFSSVGRITKTLTNSFTRYGK